jgi:phage shock protein PspC (stress-responsive transcriptional regulator)
MEQQTPPVRAPSTLRRSRTDRVLGGVCGGLGRHLGIDPVVVRIVFVVLLVFGGSGILLYLLAWLVIPEESEADAEAGAPPAPGPDSATTGRIIVGAILVGLGGLMFADRFLPALNALVGPVVLVAAGLAVVFLAVGRPTSQADTATSPPPPPPPDPSVEPIGPVTVSRRHEPGPVAVPQAWQPEPSGAPGRILLGGLLVLGGLLWLVDLAGAISLDWRVLLPFALIVVGLSTMALAWTGHRTAGFIAWGVLLTAAVVASSVLPDRLSATIGDRVERPDSIEELGSDHALGIGKLTVDLRGLELDRSRTVEASVGIGELLVLVPDDVAVEVTGRVGAGEAIAFDRSRSGVGVNLRAGISAPADAAVAPTLTLDLSVGLGKIEVRR